MLATAVETKVCRTCECEKPLSEFFRRSAGKGQVYRSSCKECEKHRDQHPARARGNGKGNGKLRPWKVQQFERVRLEYRTADRLPTEIMPPGWYKVIDKGYGIPATDVEVHLWHEILALRARVRQLEGAQA